MTATNTNAEDTNTAVPTTDAAAENAASGTAAADATASAPAPKKPRKVKTEASAIWFRDVSKSYGDTDVLKGFTFDIPAGEFLTVIGSSGSGKTTMLKLINGLLTADSGTIFIDNDDIKTWDIIALRRRIGYVIQNTGLFPHMTVRENIAYVPHLSKTSKEETDEIAEELMDIVGLEEDMLERFPNALSGGQQQRVGIARALAAKPNILLMDEPFGAVDEITRSSLQEEIARIHQEMEVTIVFITHDISEALALGNKVLVMEEGHIAQYGTPEEIRNNPATPFVAKLVGGTKVKIKNQ